MSVESTGKCKLGYSFEELCFWCFKLECNVCVYCCFFLYARHLFICEIIEIDLLGNMLSGEFITRISDEAPKNARYENVPCVKPYIMSDVQIIVIRLGLEPKTHTLKVYCSTS